MHMNHRRKNKWTAYHGWVSSKAFRQESKRQRRAKVRQEIRMGRFDSLDSFESPHRCWTVRDTMYWY